MASSAPVFFLSFVYYTFILACVEAARAVLYPVCAPVIPDDLDVSAMLASSAIAALTLLALIFAIYGVLCKIAWYADEYRTVLSGLVERVSTRVVPLVTSAVSVVLYDVVFSSPSSAPLALAGVIRRTFTIPTLLYFVAFGAAVIHRVSIVSDLPRDLECGGGDGVGLGLELGVSDIDKVPVGLLVDEKRLFSDWQRDLFAEDASKRFLYYL